MVSPVAAGYPVMTNVVLAEASTGGTAAAEVVASACAQGATGSEPLAVFTALREWKNRFR